MKLLIGLTMIILTGCAGLTCNDGYQEDMFGACSGHAGVDLKQSFPTSTVDAVEMIAITAYEEFHGSKALDTGFLQAPNLNLGDDCLPHAEWVRGKLAEQGIGGEIVVTQTEFGLHAAFMADDGRVIDINRREPLTLGEWLEFSGRL